MNKCIWLARLLSRSHNGLTFDEICEAWADEDAAGRPMARSTFYDNRRYLDDRYGICLRREGNRFRIVSPDGITPGAVNAVFAHKKNDREAQTVAAITEELAEAVRERYEVRMEYRSLTQPAYSTILRPYCLHEAEARGYVVGHSSKHGEVRNFAIDRISTLTTLATRFTQPASFSAEKWFEHSVGAWGGNHLTAERVVIATHSRRLAKRLRNRPLHASQRETGNGDLPQFVMEVAITPDFIGILLSFGAELSVDSPDYLREELCKEAKRMAEINAGQPEQPAKTFLPD